MPRKRTALTADEVARIGRAYLAHDETIAALCRRFKIIYEQLVELANVNGWPLRGRGGQRPGAQKTRLFKGSPRPRTEAEQRAERLAEEQARDVTLYGRHLADVTYLRGRGFGIDRIDIHPDSQGVNFGNTVISFAELREKADRERRIEATKKPVEPQPAKLRRGGRPRLRTNKPRSVATTIKRRVTR